MNIDPHKVVDRLLTRITELERDNAVLRVALADATAPVESETEAKE